MSFAQCLCCRCKIHAYLYPYLQLWQCYVSTMFCTHILQFEIKQSSSMPQLWSEILILDLLFWRVRQLWQQSAMETSSFTAFSCLFPNLLKRNVLRVGYTYSIQRKFGIPQMPGILLITQEIQLDPLWEPIPISEHIHFWSRASLSVQRWSKLNVLDPIFCASSVLKAQVPLPMTHDHMTTNTAIPHIGHIVYRATAMWVYSRGCTDE